MLSLDIHGLTIKEAKQAIDKHLEKIPSSIHEVPIIHGYNYGTALKDYVNKQYKHPRVIRRIKTMNPGETILVLK
ncbi:MAG: Smr/MutS family protein [Erysipelotrichaceae bacterium]